MKNRKEALSLDIVLQGVLLYTDPERFSDSRGVPYTHLVTACMLLLGFVAFFRYSDMVAVYVDENKFYDDHFEIFLEKRMKADQFRYGDVVVVAYSDHLWQCPGHLVRQVIALAPGGPLAGHVPLFQGRNGRVLRFRPYDCVLEGVPMIFSQCQVQVLRWVANVLGIDEYIIIIIDGIFPCSECKLL